MTHDPPKLTRAQDPADSLGPGRVSSCVSHLEAGRQTPMTTKPQATSDDAAAWVTATAAARLMSCSVDTVYRSLTPVCNVPNGTPGGLKLFSEADALAWKRRRAPRRSHAFPPPTDCVAFRGGRSCLLPADHPGRHKWPKEIPWGIQADGSPYTPPLVQDADAIAAAVAGGVMSEAEKARRARFRNFMDTYYFARYTDLLALEDATAMGRWEIQDYYERVGRPLNFKRFLIGSRGMPR